MCSKLGRLGRGVKYRSRRSTWLVLEVCPVAYGTTPLTGSPGWDPPSNKTSDVEEEPRGSSDPNESSPPGNGARGSPRERILEIPEKSPPGPPREICAFWAPPSPPPSWRLFSEKPGKSHFGHFGNTREERRKRACLCIPDRNSRYFGPKNAISGKIQLNLPCFAYTEGPKMVKKVPKKAPTLVFIGFLTVK